MQKRKAIILMNLGTPSAPTPTRVRAYLREFLSDPDVVSFRPRWLWHCLLNGLILPFRARRSAQRYQQIWMPEGSPLWVYMQRLATVLAAELDPEDTVRVAMRYGQPSIQEVVKSLSAEGYEEWHVLPLYPQYAVSTTRTCWSAFSSALSKQSSLPKVIFYPRYALQVEYLNAIEQMIVQYLSPIESPSAFQGISPSHTLAGIRYPHVIMSFHGIPVAAVEQGDPYASECQSLFEALRARLSARGVSASIAFQSRFGPAKWVQPYLNDVLKSCIARGDLDVCVVCPGFSVDCLETLEEIATEAKSDFLAWGGRSFAYIPALNDTPGQVAWIKALVDGNTQASI